MIEEIELRLASSEVLQLGRGPATLAPTAAAARRRFWVSLSSLDGRRDDRRSATRTKVGEVGR
eukprot:5812335-Prymnesium_polylepis.1